ncbi:MAG: hypothetical protein EZS28_011044 [Streblomastix strix]|uniref:Uncharacterized protein n=1 Tax=Streblomastix strix TaxID=222440 RepID=A0A5J4WET8_9EUKA|nr:MAG: hypothetical protein EZS28_011044 [Streblomastix strix]
MMMKKMIALILMKARMKFTMEKVTVSVTMEKMIEVLMITVSYQKEIMAVIPMMIKIKRETEVVVGINVIIIVLQMVKMIFIRVMAIVFAVKENMIGVLRIIMYLQLEIMIIDPYLEIMIIILMIVSVKREKNEVVSINVIMIELLQVYNQFKGGDNIYEPNDVGVNEPKEGDNIYELSDEGVIEPKGGDNTDQLKDKGEDNQSNDGEDRYEEGEYNNDYLMLNGGDRIQSSFDYQLQIPDIQLMQDSGVSVYSGDLNLSSSSFYDLFCL